ncbi:MAG: thylakoid membrane photosystem I accumulation factor [Xenococcaceae cyanobacterium]
MNFIYGKFFKANLKNFWQTCLNVCSICAIALVFSLFVFGTLPAHATITDDRYEGNIYVLYAGNGSLVPPRSTLAESLKKETPAILVFYVDDSSDCKEYSLVVSRFQEYYGRAANLIPVNVDTLPVKSKYTPEEPGYYYEGVVPQTVIIDEEGKVAFNGRGQVKFEEADDALRKVFDLLPRTESLQLKRRSFNEFNAELVN